MNKWPILEDRVWPKDLPAEYFENNTPKWSAITPILIGLIRRVEILERELSVMRGAK